MLPKKLLSIGLFVPTQHSSWSPPEKTIQRTEVDAVTSDRTEPQKSYVITSTELSWSHRSAPIRWERRPRKDVNPGGKNHGGQRGGWRPQLSHWLRSQEGWPGTGHLKTMSQRGRKSSSLSRPSLITDLSCGTAPQGSADNSHMARAGCRPNRDGSAHGAAGT